MTDPKIQISKFVTRQTQHSPFSYFGGSWQRLEQLATLYVNTGTLKDGVLTVPVPAEGFFCGVIKLGDKHKHLGALSATFQARRDGEEPYIDVLASGEKTPAVAVDLILYNRDLLRAEGETVPDWIDYEIVCINARNQLDSEPMHPVTMARNFLGLPGGTLKTYTADEFAKAIIYWSQHAMHGGGQ